MVSTRKVTALAVSLIIVDCLLAGVAVAAVTGTEAMEQTIALVGLVAVMAALNVALVRLHLRDWREKRQRQKEREDDPLGQIFAEELENSTDLQAFLTSIAAKVSRHEKLEGELENLREALKPIIEDYMLGKAERNGENAGRP